MTTALHVAFAVAGTLFLWRAALRVSLGAPDDAVAAALAPAVVIATALASVAAIAAGRTVWSARRALALDAATIGASAAWLAVLTLGPWTRELGGVSLVAIAAARLAPGAVAVATLRAPAWLAFAVALGAYGALATWLPAASLPFGDQVHYLIGAEQLRRGTLDATIDAELFRSLVGVSPGRDDVATHVADTPLGPRPIQGYAVQLLLLPGWIAAGRGGAHLVMAIVGAWVALQTFLILRDLSARGTLPARSAGAAWILATFLAPMAPLATHLYPNMPGAAIVATAFRAGFTAPARRPALAAAVLSLTLFLTPRDAIALAVLGPFLFVLAPRTVAIAAGAVALVAVALNGILYGLPLPYAGYVFGTGQAQEITREPSIVPSFWIGLPAILLDRTHGLAGTAPWVFLGLAGLVPLLRSERARRRDDPGARPVLVPAALAVGTTVLALSFFRLWEGGYAPPARYLVDVLPLWAPFVAAGLAVTRGWIAAPLAAILVLASALASLVLAGIPTTALNGAFDHQVRFAFGGIVGSLDPLSWLPSFQPTVPDWAARAYPRAALAAAILAGLAWAGWRRRDELGAAGRPRWSVLVTHPAAFAAANLALVALFMTAAVLRQSFPEPFVPATLSWKWLPLALAVALAGTLAVSRGLEARERRALFAGHLLVYVPALWVLVVRHAGGPQVLNAVLGAAYLAVAVVFAVNALAALWRAVDRLPDRAVALRVAVVALGAFLVLLPYHSDGDRSAIMPTASDEPHYLLIVQSLVYDADVDLRNDYEGDRYGVFYPARLPDMHGIEVGRAVFPIRDLGLPLLAAIPFAIAGRVGVVALMCLAAALFAYQSYLLLRDLRFAPRPALLAVATTSLTHPVLTYTTQVYPELLVALAFVTVARLLRAGTATSARDLALASALVGTLPVLATRAWPIAVGLGIVVAYAALRPLSRARDRAAWIRVAAAALPFAAIVAALSLANWRMFGVFLPSAGYYIIRDQQQVLAFAPHLGAIGLLFDRVFGLVPRAPVYLLAFLGAALLWRRARAGHGAQVSALALGAGLSFLYIANIAYWWADGSPPSRYLLGGIPLLVAAVAGGWEVALSAAGRAGTALRALAWGSVAGSAAVTFVYAMQPNTRYDLALDVRASGSTGALWSFLDGRIGLDPGVWFPSMVSPTALAWALAVAWLAAGGALVWTGTRPRA